ncbi:MAG: hypothetical protein WD825_08065 [Gemmatimonadaceae bacterium]
MESGNGFTQRHRWAIAAGTAIAAVVLLVVVYKASAPRSAPTTTASGDRIPESEVLQVGALPVT